MNNKTLSFQSSGLLQKLNQENSTFFSLDKAYQLLPGSAQPAVRRLLSDMTARGLLLRLKNGLYCIIPYDQDASTYFPNSHLIAKHLAAGTNFYLGYYSAMEIHSLITQPALREQIVVDKQIKPSALKIKGHKFQFIYHNKDHFFGIKNIWIDNFNKVPCSDLEKTFIDCLYKPDYAGGVTEIAKALFKSKEKIDYEKLFDYCKKFKTQSVIKRLGFLLEVLDIHNPIIEKLQQLKTATVILLEPSYEKKGELIDKWNVQQNINTTDITSSIFT
ncbi:MAG: transcriptional regulator [Bacteroidetes bacterium]|nr:transcriptional regulator [Bacteroidota bacterium]